MAFDSKLLLWIATLVQWGMMFVMFFVKFKMFTIIGLFLIPMLILQLLVACLIILQFSKSLYFSHLADINFVTMKKAMNDLSFHCGVFVLPQPIYYMTVEFMKFGGKY